MQFLVFVQVQDISPFSYGLSSDEGPNGVIFPKGQPIPSTAILGLQRTNLFHLEAFYANPKELPPGTVPKISSFTVCSL
jgi:heat shock protein 4